MIKSYPEILDLWQFVSPNYYGPLRYLERTIVLSFSIQYTNAKYNGLIKIESLLRHKMWMTILGIHYFLGKTRLQKCVAIQKAIIRCLSNVL